MGSDISPTYCEQDDGSYECMVCGWIHGSAEDAEECARQDAMEMHGMLAEQGIVSTNRRSREQGQGGE